MLLSALPYGLYGEPSITFCQSAFESLKSYLSEKQETFDLNKTITLVNTQLEGNRHKIKRNDAIRYFTMLSEVIEFGYIRSDLFVGQRYYAFLTSDNRNLFDNFINLLAGYSESALFSCKGVCSKLLLLIQLDHPDNNYSVVTLEQLDRYLDTTKQGKGYGKLNLQPEFLAYLHKHRNLPGCYQY